MNKSPSKLKNSVRYFFGRLTIPFIIILMLLSIAFSYKFLADSTATLASENSKNNAKRYLEAISAFRSLYTSEVVIRAKKNGMQITHDYLNVENAIPLPATLSMALGQELGKTQSGARTFLYSPYPFPWRKKENKDIFTQNFATDAWQSLIKNPELPFYRFEKVNGQQSIRYAIADLMRPACIDCHNNHPDTPKNDWEIGDVRGVIEVILPISVAQEQAQLSLKTTFIVLGFLAVILFVIVALFLGKIKKDANALKTSNTKLLEQQNDINLVNAEIKLTNNKLEQQAIELINSNNVKSDFLATMSHEIRTPINGVIGLLTLLKQSSLDEHQQQHVHLASLSSDTLLRLINDILDFSKIESGKLEIEVVEFDLLKLMSDTSVIMAHKAQSKNLELIVDFSNISSGLIKGDPSRIRQILNNLLSNAIKFTAQGDILIQVQLEEIDEHNIWFCCQIIDSGIGIESNKLNQMFERFTQADTSTTRNYGGTGLGLAITKKLCQLMKGDIKVQSNLGEGSKFSFRVNLEKVICEDDSSGVKLSGSRVLVIDDNEKLLNAIYNQLLAFHVEIVKTCKGDKFLTLLENNLRASASNNFNCILIDQNILQMYQTNLSALLIQMNKIDAIKIIELSPLKHHINQNKADKYITRPVVPNSLFNVITNEKYSNNINKDTSTTIIDKSILANTRILLVEDNPINQIVAKGFLKGFNIDLCISINGVEALRELEKSSFDLILMDCQMPVMDGYETTQKIRASSSVYQDIYIIAMTANAMKGDRDKCFKVGMNEYISKPIDVEDLTKKLISAAKIIKSNKSG